MIIDKIENLKLYKGLNPLMGMVLEFLQQNNLSTLDNGKHSILGNRLFVNIEDDKGKSKQDAVMEFHRKMIDIQIPLNEPETYGYTPVSDLPYADFDTTKDIAKLQGVAPREYITAKPGEFVMFFPQDGHAPCIADGILHKAIFKVAAE